MTEDSQILSSPADRAYFYIVSINETERKFEFNSVIVKNKSWWTNLNTHIKNQHPKFVNEMKNKLEV